MKPSIWKKIKLFIEYNKFLKENKTLLLTKFNLKIDWIGRVYTVLNIPEDENLERYGSDVSVNKHKFEFENKLSHSYIQKYIKMLDNFLIKNDLKELVGIYDINKIDDRNYLLIFGFSLFNSEKIYRNGIIFFILTLIGLLTYFI